MHSLVCLTVRRFPLGSWRQPGSWGQPGCWAQRAVRSVLAVLCLFIWPLNQIPATVLAQELYSAPFENPSFISSVEAAENSGFQSDRNIEPTLERLWASQEDSRSHALAWGDANNDGDLDLVVGNDVAPNYIYFNTNGTLNPTFGWESAEWDRTRSVAWADIDGDGELDLAVGNNGDPNRVYMNSGSGLVNDASWSSNDRDVTYSVAWADVDNDGDPDLAVGNVGQPNRIYRNDNGTLTTTGVWASDLADDTYSVAWADVDDDGDLDLAVGNQDQPNRLYLNNDGILSSTSSWQSAELDSTKRVIWGDIDNDGDLDLLAGNDGQPNRLYRNDNGQLTSASVWQTTESDRTTSLALADADGDGDLDLMVGNHADNVSRPNRYYVNTGTQIAATAIVTTATWTSTIEDKTNDLAWADVNNDGLLDLATANLFQSETVLRNVASFVAQEPVWASTTVDGRIDVTKTVAWGDVDDDGDLDLIVGNQGTPNVLYANENGSLSTSPLWHSAEADETFSVAWGDVDNDGDLDLIVGNMGQPNRLYRNQDGQLSTTADWSSSVARNTWHVSWGDMDNDGDLDLAVGNGYEKNEFYRNDNGTLTALPVWESVDANDSRSLAWGDVDGDADLDVVVGNWGQMDRLYKNVNGTFIIGGYWNSSLNRNTHAVALADLDNDGDLDLIAGHDSQKNGVYTNVDGRLERTPSWVSLEEDNTTSLAVGDMDGDGDLDLATGTWNNADRIYRNDGGTLTEAAIWASQEKDHTFGVAWADFDGDGDLDLSTAKSSAPNYIYLNLRHTPVSRFPTQPALTLERPGQSAAAGFYSAPKILHSATISIPYRLIAPLERPYFIWPQYKSTKDEGWIRANHSVRSNPERQIIDGAAQNQSDFLWNGLDDMQEDVKSDNVTFRIQIASLQQHSPIYWPKSGNVSPSFRVAPQQYIRVLDQDLDPVPNAVVYAAQQDIGTTNDAGLLNPGSEPLTTQLAALKEVARQSTTRLEHDGWAYRTLLKTSTIESTPTGEQLLTTQKEEPLILFNLVVSIEWNANTAYMEEIKQAFEQASKYLFDVTDGQMAIQHVSIFDNAEQWPYADIRIFAKNRFRPHAYVGGILSQDTTRAIHLGRQWDRRGGVGGWDQPDGYRTIIHEFGHYGLHLYDEYLFYIYDESGNLISKAKAICPKARALLTSRNEEVNGSIMYWQYTTTELSARNIPGLWHSQGRTSCEETLHWQVTEELTGQGESTWETLARMYADTNDPARWRIVTPIDRQSVLPGPTELPTYWPQWPRVSIADTGSSSVPVRQLTVSAPEQAHQNAFVTLFTSRGQTIDQGFTDRDGRIVIVGAAEGDRLQATSRSGAYSAALIVGPEVELELFFGVKRTQRASR
ncbi:MAG: VCBS repeat-containing protein [Chloroflexota bacterium]